MSFVCIVLRVLSCYNFLNTAWRVAKLAVEQSSHWQGQYAPTSRLSSAEPNSKTIASWLHQQNLLACAWVLTWLAEILQHSTDEYAKEVANMKGVKLYTIRTKASQSNPKSIG